MTKETKINFSVELDMKGEYSPIRNMANNLKIPLTMYIRRMIKSEMKTKEIYNKMKP